MAFEKGRKDLMRRARAAHSDQVEQGRLHEKHGLLDREDVYIVETKNWGDTLRKLLLDIAIIILGILAFVGICALVYPAPRAELHKIFMDTFSQIRELLGI